MFELDFSFSELFLDTNQVGLLKIFFYILKAKLLDSASELGVEKLRRN